MSDTSQQVDAARAEAATREIENFWREVAPDAPPDLLWHFAGQAAMAHPGNLAQQALYAAEQAAKVVSAAKNPPRSAAPTPARAPEQPAGTKPTYSTLVQLIKQRQPVFDPLARQPGQRRGDSEL